MATDPNNSLDLESIRISALNDTIDISSFACGIDELDLWIRTKCKRAHDLDRTKVFCAHFDGQSTALGVYTLSRPIESAKDEAVPYRGLYPNNLPAVYLRQLAVSRRYQNQRLGTLLLLNALEKAYWISRNFSYCGVALRSLNDRTTALYSKYGFTRRGDDAMPLMILPVWSLRDLFEGSPAPAR
jgi:GNAT superfamily N-acetyltransferase